LRKSVGSNVVLVVDRAGQKTFAERAERHEADAQFLKRRQDFALRFAPPQ